MILKPKTIDEIARNINTQVLCIGITGGIASGKSYVCRQLEQAGHQVFYCDDEAKRIIRTDEQVKQALRQLVGPGVYDADGQLVKSQLAAFLCRGKQCSAQVDAIVHPRVAEAFASRVEQKLLLQHLESDSPTDRPVHPKLERWLTVTDLATLDSRHTLFMECALLFESGFDRLVNHSVLVHVSQQTQVQRLMARDGISADQAAAWMALQLSEDERLQRAHSVILNE